MSNGTLKTGEFHPSANSAMVFVREQLSSPHIFYTKEALASNALSGNRLCEICIETLDRVEKNEPVSDRYLLGLAWFLKELDEVQPKRE